MPRLNLNETMQRLLLLIRSGYPVIYIVSHEERRVMDYLAKIVRVIRQENPGKEMLRWSDGIGLEQLTGLSPHTVPKDQDIDWLSVPGLPSPMQAAAQGNANAQAALTSIKNAAPGGGFQVLTDSLTVFFDMHPMLQDNMLLGADSLVRPLRNTAAELRKYYDDNRARPGKFYKTVVIVAPAAQKLSPELERDIIVMDFPLPETDELRGVLQQMVDSEQLQYEPDATPADRTHLSELIAGAGRGLTLEDYRRGLSLFAVRHETLSQRRIEDMLNLKAKAINNLALQYTPHVTIELGGLENIKKWIRSRSDAVSSETIRQRFRLPTPKGLFLTGVSGGGKSQLAKLIATQFNLALLRLDVGALFGSYVGESEERTRVALQLAEVLAPVVLWLDEVDKAFTGIAAGGDNGVSARVFGSFLTWLSEKQDSVFVVTTANNFNAILQSFPEFGRRGRFDAIYWVDLPGADGRRDIFRIYLKPHYDAGYLVINDEQLRALRPAAVIASEPQDADALERLCWLLCQDALSGNLTGAEIEHAVNEALYEAYKQAQASGDGEVQGALNVQQVVAAVNRANNEALYRPGSPEHATLQNQRNAVNQNGWPKA